MKCETCKLPVLGWGVPRREIHVWRRRQAYKQRETEADRGRETKRLTE